MNVILDKINAFYTTYRTITNAIIAVTAILGILTVGYTYVQKADANELAITKGFAETAVALTEIKETYTPILIAMNLQSIAAKNTRQTRLNTLEISLSAKEKRRQRLIDKHPNMKTLPANSTPKEEYTEVLKAIKKLEKKISAIEAAIETETE